MPKLPKNIQDAAENAEDRDFTAIPAGLYRLRVKEVDVSKKTASGDPKWVFVFEVLAGPNDLTDEKYKGRQLWEHCALTENAAWKLKQIFAALGFTLDSDADELVGEVCQAVVSQGEITAGTRKGQMGNNQDQYLEDTGDGELVGAAAGAGGKKAGKKGDPDF